MDENPFYRRAAKAISDLINQRSWSPTIDEIAQIIEEEWLVQSQALEERPPAGVHHTPILANLRKRISLGSPLTKRDEAAPDLEAMLNLV